MRRKTDHGALKCKQSLRNYSHGTGKNPTQFSRNPRFRQNCGKSANRKNRYLTTYCARYLTHIMPGDFTFVDIGHRATSSHCSYSLNNRPSRERSRIKSSYARFWASLRRIAINHRKSTIKWSNCTSIRMPEPRCPGPARLDCPIGGRQQRR